MPKRYVTVKRYFYLKMTLDFSSFENHFNQVKNVLKEMEEVSPLGKQILNRSELILTEPALVYDSVFVFAKGLEKAIEAGPELRMT